MNISNIIRSKSLWALPIVLLALVLTIACSDDDPAQETKYGYAQFRIVKADTRAAGDMVENLADAAKLRVVLVHDGMSITQTVLLRRFNDESAEFGLQSDKLKLVEGAYALTGFYLYDALDQEIYADGGGNVQFRVEADGLHYQELAVASVLKGRATFQLVKRFVETRADAEPSYPFSSIKGASFTVRNLFTKQTYNIDKVRVSIVDGYETDASGKRTDTSMGECDTIVWLPVGTYQVTGYTTYSDSRCRYALETATVAAAPSFVVTKNETTENAEVPVLLSKTSERMKDYLALKAIWDALDGPNWSYHGEAEAAGANWNFDKDMDLWGDQPGVSLDSEGRVQVLSLIGFGARGVVPDDIGQLTRLHVLYLGAHDESLGSMTGKDLSTYDTPEYLARLRSSYESLFLNGDARMGMSETLREWVAKDEKQRPIQSARIQPKDVQMGYLTNQIKGISRALSRCVELQQFYIANSPITAEDFFRDIQPSSPFYGEELSWGNLKALTDVEIYNCPKMTALPMEMLSQVPILQVLNVAANQGISGKQLLADWEALIDGACGAKVQVIYMGFNNLEETPKYEQLRRMSSLSAIDLSYNFLHTVHPFGKEINLVKLYLNNNYITRIYPAPDGYFSDFIDVETMNFAYNDLTELPDIFNAKSVYVIGSVDFSHNKITHLEHGSAFKGINTSSLTLSYNPFAEFPREIFATGSPISSFVMSGCGLREIKKGDMTGPETYLLRSIDLSLNRLKELPEDFYATNMPYLYGVDVTGNQFDAIPVQPLDCYSLTVLIARNQRDDEGNRTLRSWLTGIYQHPQLRALYLGGNDLRKIEDTISPNIYVFEIKDNPNISIDISDVCPYIEAGYYFLYYDPSQDIRGCGSVQLDH